MVANDQLKTPHNITCILEKALSYIECHLLDPNNSLIGKYVANDYNNESFIENVINNNFILSKEKLTMLIFKWNEIEDEKILKKQISNICSKMKMNLTNIQVFFFLIITIIIIISNRKVI